MFYMITVEVPAGTVKPKVSYSFGQYFGSLLSVPSKQEAKREEFTPDGNRIH
jgi:hypothetical protein